MLQAAGRVIGIANTHLIWVPPGTASTAKLGYRQALQLLSDCQNIVPSPAG